MLNCDLILFIGLVAKGGKVDLIWGGSNAVKRPLYLQAKKGHQHPGGGHFLGPTSVGNGGLKTVECMIPEAYSSYVKGPAPSS